MAFHVIQPGTGTLIQVDIVPGHDGEAPVLIAVEPLLGCTVGKLYGADTALSESDGTIGTGEGHRLCYITGQAVLKDGSRDGKIHGKAGRGNKMELQGIPLRSEIAVLPDHGMLRHGETRQVGNFVLVQLDIHAVESGQVDDILDLGEIEKDVFFNPDAQVLTNQPAQRFGTEVVVDVIDAAVVLLVLRAAGFEDGGIADNGGQHNPVRVGIQG